MSNYGLYRFFSAYAQIGGHSTFFGLLNTFVHIVMYSYYLFSALGEQYQKYLWWKKYLTALQMVRNNFRSVLFLPFLFTWVFSWNHLHAIIDLDALSIWFNLWILRIFNIFLSPNAPFHSIHRFNLFWSWSMHSNYYSLTAITQERSSGGSVSRKFWFIVIN